MAVDSYLELFTTLYAWLFYNIIWDVMVSSGIALIPFIGIVLDNVLSAYAKNDIEDAGSSALKAIEMEVILAFVVITFAANPFFQFQANAITYTPPGILTAPPAPQVSAADNTQSTFATVSFVGHPNVIDVPVWWWAAHAMSAGINRAIMTAVPGVLDYRNYMNEINDMRIDDPFVKQNVNDFFRDCFIPARSKYNLEKPSTPAIDALLTTYGSDDPDWVGSRVYLNTAGYYNELRAAELVIGFPFDPLRDKEWDPAIDPLPTWGRPTCAQWWNGQMGGCGGACEGLKSDLLDPVTGLGDWDTLVDTYEPPFAAIDIRQDAVIRMALILENGANKYQARGYDYAYSNRVSDNDYMLLAEKIGKAGATTYTAIGMNAKFAVFLDMFLKAAPMAQALLLMGIVTLLPFLLIISRYRLPILMSGALLIFSVKFWTVLWYLAYWVDQNLILALYPQVGAMLMSPLAGADLINNRIILNMMTGLLYLGLPMLFSVIMGVAGFSAGSELTSIGTNAGSRLGGGRNILGRIGSKGADAYKHMKKK